MSRWREDDLAINPEGGSRTRSPHSHHLESRAARAEDGDGRGGRRTGGWRRRGGAITQHKPTIADVHTQPTDEGGNIVGKVLHVATDNPRLFTVTLDTCVGPRTYRGFVSSYREVVTQGFQRLDGQEWEKRRASTPDVDWMKDLLAP